MFLLHVCYASGDVHIVPFPSAFARALAMITLAGQPVTLRVSNEA